MLLINNGQMVNKTIGKTEEFNMQLLGEESIDEMIFLQQSVYDGLPNKDVLAVDQPEEILAGLKSGGFIIGIYNSMQQLIAYRYVAIPQNEKHNMGHDLHLPYREMHEVAHLETTIVHPDYRGNGIQSKTLQAAFPILKDKGMKHVICTVSPFNFFSLMNIMKNGLKIKVLTKKYGHNLDGSDGLWRFILHRNLHEQDSSAYKSLISVGLDRFNVQMSLLEKGFVGNYLSSDGKTLAYVR